jgi:hypothetical protein
MILLEKHVTPVLTDKQYKDLDRTYLTPDHGANEIEPNTVYWDWAERSYNYYEGQTVTPETRRVKQVKFVLLPKALSPAAWLKATTAAREYKGQMKKGTRAGDGQVYGKKLTLGWLPMLPGHAQKSGYHNVRTAPTLEQPRLLAAMFPLLREMDQLIHTNLPEYHKFALNCALSAERPDVDGDDLNRISDSYSYSIAKNLDPWNMVYTIRGTVFSTVEFNRNIIFKAHEDGHNVDGTCVCITTLDTFAGGRLVFPRYGYSAELGPMDLLICDNNHELHGNLGPIVGDRYSVVAFLHERLMGRGPEPVD